MEKLCAYNIAPAWKECGKVFEEEVFQEIVKPLDKSKGVNYILLKVRHIERVSQEEADRADEIWLMRTSLCNHGAKWIATTGSGIYYDWFEYIKIVAYCYLDDPDENLQPRR